MSASFSFLAEDAAAVRPLMFPIVHYALTEKPEYRAHEHGDERATEMLPDGDIHRDDPRFKKLLARLR